MRYITIFLILLNLTGCASMQYSNEMLAKGAAEDAAIDKVEADAPGKCAEGREASALSRKEYLTYNQCVTQLARNEVSPIATFPDILNLFLLKITEDAEQYAKGDITYDLLKAREQVARDEYTAEWQKRYVAALQEYRALDASVYSGMGDTFKEQEQRRRESMPRMTHCNIWGNTANCITQ